MKSSFALLGLATLAAAAPTLEERQTGGCVPAGAVHMIVARASTEIAGQGIIGQVATMVQNALPGSDSVAVNYPATLQNYQSSESQGVTAMKTLITNYVSQCPTSKIALLGPSPGPLLHPVLRLCMVLNTSIVVAVIEMGDPSHVAGQPYNVGTSTKNGLFPRANAASCQGKTYTQSYCDTGDTFCDAGGSIQVHLAYVQKYGSQAASYIQERVKGAA
ncbi:carbohydrate esterase family 5 protein [Diplocarpon rosae]|nr:carbohydrate esterase family 5 protein [Diplocarpon rosae]